MQKEIKTTGDLRKYLSDILVKVESDEVSIEKAGVIAKVTAQINESMHAEIRQQKLQLELKREVGALGKTLIGSGE